ncbi:HDOD domain-containing protein [Vibrio profundum]|uniref:HDOD domain-containing protein n=1 Tax=Vibrio profundum TaxID=2910247 RepID=UPI003D0E3A29
MSQLALINRLNELPRINKVLQDLLEMVNQEDVDFNKLANKITIDQVLSARLLRMANSAYFGSGKNISSSNEALIRVGIGPVRTLVVASVLSSAFPKIPTLDLHEYWENTFEVSVISSKLAEEVGLDKNEALTTGVLHNIGELMIHTLAPQEAKQIVEQVASGVDPIIAQQQVVETCSPALGAKLAQSWKFPELMVNAISSFNEPAKAELSKTLAMILHLARSIHRDWDGFASDQEKMSYLEGNYEAKQLGVVPAFSDTINTIRGEGKGIASQMFG